MDKIINNLHDDNEKYYIEHDRETGVSTIEDNPDKDKRTRFTKLFLM